MHHRAIHRPLLRGRLKSRVFAAATGVLLVSPGMAVAQGSLPAEAPISAKFLPTPEDVVRPEHAAVVDRILRRMERAKTRSDALPPLNAALAKLDEPSATRGLVQYWRAGLLMYRSNAEAEAAIEESIRLLPGYSAPLIAAAAIYTYANQPGRGADYFLRAVSIDPASVRKVEDYEIGNMIRRLQFAGEIKRADAVSARLLEIGWIGSALGSSSSLALAAIRERIAAGNEAGARALATKLLAPRDSYELLVDNRYKAVWEPVERWGGQRLTAQWAIYLREARERWLASKNVETARDYAAALAQAGHNRTLIREFLPVFNGKLDETNDHSLQFVVPMLADALGREGQWGDAERLFSRAQAIWPLSNEDNQNSLNIASNRARSLYHQGKFAAALPYLDQAIRLARKWEVNPDAVVAMTLYRACILQKLGRTEEAKLAGALVAASARATTIVNLHLCLGSYADAREALLQGLRMEKERSGALLYVQPDVNRPFASDHMRQAQAETARLRADPLVKAEVAKHGRILPYSVQAGAPAEGVR